MYTVSASREALRFDRECACCLQPTDALLRVSRHKGGSAIVVYWEVSSSIEVPYCTSCKRHALWYQEGGWLGVALRAGSFFFITALVSPLLLLLIGLEGYAVLAAAAALGLIAAGLSIRRRLQLRPDGPVDSRHARKGLAVELDDFSDRELHLRLHNNVFAERTLSNTPGAAGEKFDGHPGMSSETVGQVAGLLVLVVLAAIYFLFLR